MVQIPEPWSSKIVSYFVEFLLFIVFDINHMIFYLIGTLALKMGVWLSDFHFLFFKRWTKRKGEDYNWGILFSKRLCCFECFWMTLNSIRAPPFWANYIISSTSMVSPFPSFFLLHSYLFRSTPGNTKSSRHLRLSYQNHEEALELTNHQSKLLIRQERWFFHGNFKHRVSPRQQLLWGTLLRLFFLSLF